ncbi:protein of unknown function [Maridesulfovibrio hydrothermalis AM13 = DSM 14728]|uniref:Uncharacterized protein n=1 Tax=Maridesulfovibrio hydrothermalis AM13 = DSM 14728 TaxID=1121451 RepID=L0RGS7_9BACT|nr:protein of unknown function [Maridesulfovibrio hydrothermalis AM13 = DSM 14728]
MLFGRIIGPLLCEIFLVVAVFGENRVGRGKFFSILYFCIRRYLDYIYTWGQ